MKSFLKSVFILLFLAVIVVPVFAVAQDEKPIIPECGNIVGGKIDKECGYAELIQLVNNIINWIVWISVPTAAAVFAWAGFKYMTTGVVDQKAAAKAMLQKVFIGFVAILAAWIIITTITKALLSDKFPKEAMPVEDAMPTK